MSGFAWVTLATNDSYSLGALVLAHSLRQVGTVHQLAVLVTPGVTATMRQKLDTVFTVVKEVNILDSRDEANLRLLKRPELGITFTKLHCWRLTQFEKCVFLDADTMVLTNVDELFDREELSAAPDVGWPDCFNSGVFVYRPSEDTYGKLVQFTLEKGSFDGGDQGLLNLYFSDWAHKDISKHLPFVYNVCSTACYSYLPAFKQFGENIKIIHFIGNAKPWLQYFDTETRQVTLSSNLQHLQGVVQHWWNIFCSLVHPQLSPDMAPNRATATYHNPYYANSKYFPFFCDPSHTYSELEKINQDSSEYKDPWDEYEQIHNFPAEQDLCTDAPVCFLDFEKRTHYDTVGRVIESDHIDIICCSTDTVTESHTSTRADIDYDSNYSDYLENYDKNDIGNFEKSFNNTDPVTPAFPATNIHNPECNNLAWPHECEPSSSVTNESALHAKPVEAHNSNAGLAGAFARLTLGVSRTAEQTVLEDHLRRQGWEVGNIDYLGRDSFNNIWGKICETLSTPQPSMLSSPVPQQFAATPQEQPIVPTTEDGISTNVSTKPQVPEPATTVEAVDTPEKSSVESIQQRSDGVIPKTAETHILLLDENSSVTMQPNKTSVVESDKPLTTECALPSKHIDLEKASDTQTQSCTQPLPTTTQLIKDTNAQGITAPSSNISAPVICSEPVSPAIEELLTMVPTSPIHGSAKSDNAQTIPSTNVIFSTPVATVQLPTVAPSTTPSVSPSIISPVSVTSTSTSSEQISKTPITSSLPTSLPQTPTTSIPQLSTTSDILVSSPSITSDPPTSTFPAPPASTVATPLGSVVSDPPIPVPIASTVAISTDSISSPPFSSVSITPVSPVSVLPACPITVPPASPISVPPTCPISVPPVSPISVPPPSPISVPPPSTLIESPVSPISAPPVSTVSTTPVSATSASPVSTFSSPIASTVSSSIASTITDPATSVPLASGTVAHAPSPLLTSPPVGETVSTTSSTAASIGKTIQSQPAGGKQGKGPGPQKSSEPSQKQAKSSNSQPKSQSAKDNSATSEISTGDTVGTPVPTPPPRKTGGGGGSANKKGGKGKK